MKKRVLLASSVSLMMTATLVAQFTSQPCPPSLSKVSARCGVVTVPEKAGGVRNIGINIVVLPATTQTNNAVPLFHLDGGPGIAGTNAAGFYVEAGGAYHATRDVVLIDQRGTGHSNPLRCDALEHRPTLAAMYSDADVGSCLRDLKNVADLTAYSTTESARDIDAVRSALGYEKIDIWALSYGTRLAQEYMRLFPSRVVHAVLTGLVPSDYRPPLYHAANSQRVLDLVFSKCQADPQCGARYPGLRSDWAAVQQAVRRGIRTKDSAPIASGPFFEAVRGLLGTAAGQRQLPSLIHAASSGDFGALLKRFPKGSSQFAEGLYLSIVCSEGIARIDDRSVAPLTNGTFLGDYRVAQEKAACASWPRYETSAAFYEPLRESPAILVLEGEMDHVASPDWGRAFCDRLPRCRFVLVPDYGHSPEDLEQWTHGECLDDLAVAFFQDADHFETTCLKSMRPPAFQ